jgi:hypothetical protein
MHGAECKNLGRLLLLESEKPNCSPTYGCKAFQSECPYLQHGKLFAACPHYDPVITFTDLTTGKGLGLKLPSACLPGLQQKKASGRLTNMTSGSVTILRVVD